MSRWLSREKAARRAERAAQDMTRRGKEKRRMWLLLAGLAVVSVGLTVADYFWLRSVARERHENRYHHGGRTNAPASAPLPVAGQSQATNLE